MVLTFAPEKVGRYALRVYGCARWLTEREGSDAEAGCWRCRRLLVALVGAEVARAGTDTFQDPNDTPGVSTSARSNRVTPAGMSRTRSQPSTTGRVRSWGGGRPTSSSSRSTSTPTAARWSGSGRPSCRRAATWSASCSTSRRHSLRHEPTCPAQPGTPVEALDPPRDSLGRSGRLPVAGTRLLRGREHVRRRLPRPGTERLPRRPRSPAAPFISFPQPDPPADVTYDVEFTVRDAGGSGLRSGAWSSASRTPAPPGRPSPRGRRPDDKPCSSRRCPSADVRPVPHHCRGRAREQQDQPAPDDRRARAVDGLSARGSRGPPCISASKIVSASSPARPLASGVETARLLAEEGARVVVSGRDESGSRRRGPTPARRWGRGGSCPAGGARRADRPRRGGVRAGRLPGQQRRHRRARRVRGALRRRLGLDVAAERHELRPRYPRRCCRACASAAPAAIVNVSSTAGKRPSTSMPHYSVTKAAVLSLSRLVADLYAADGILCNAVTPGRPPRPRGSRDGGLADQAAARSGKSREEVLAASPRAGRSDVWPSRRRSPP